MIDEELTTIDQRPLLFQTPWVPTPEMFEREGPYADFCAWELWMARRMDVEHDDAFGCWEQMDVFSRIAFFSAMVDACKFAAENPAHA